MFCAWLIRRWNFAYLHHIHTRESPSEYSERRYWSTLMYVVLKFLSCLQFQYQTAGIRKLLVRWCGLIFLHSYLGGVLKFFDIWLGLAASSNVKEFQYSSSVTVQEYPILTRAVESESREKSKNRKKLNKIGKIGSDFLSDFLAKMPKCLHFGSKSCIRIFYYIIIYLNLNAYNSGTRGSTKVRRILKWPQEQGLSTC